MPIFFLYVGLAIGFIAGIVTTLIDVVMTKLYKLLGIFNEKDD